jgi:hypothetical protein
MGPDHSYTLSSSALFLQLPREIRDLIYEHLLVQDAILIECAITKPPSSSAPDALDDPSHDLSIFHPLRAPRLHRRLWPVPAFDMDHSLRERSQTVYMTYQFDKQMSSSFATSLDLSLLQTNKQIYAEASKVFYGSNIFSFTGDCRIPTAFAFLCDRPASSLCLIKYLELALMEDTNMRGTPYAHYPVVRRSTDSLVLQYAYHYFTELCTLLSTSRIQLQKLYLTIETMSQPSQSTPFNLHDSLDREQLALAGLQPQTPLWLDPLLKIEQLQSIEVCWIARHPRLRRMACTTATMRRHMLASTQDDDSHDQLVESDLAMTSFCFSVLHQTEKDPLPVVDRPGKWDEAVLNGDDLRYIQKTDDSRDKAVPSNRSRYHLEEALTMYMDVYVCFCKMNCA